MKTDKVSDRTADAWMAEIKKHLPEEWWCKIACTVWWDYVTTKAFNQCRAESKAWFREMLDAYDIELSEMQADTLGSALELVGYPEREIKRVTKTSFYEARPIKGKRNRNAAKYA